MSYKSRKAAITVAQTSEYEANKKSEVAYRVVKARNTTNPMCGEVLVKMEIDYLINAGMQISITNAPTHQR